MVVVVVALGVVFVVVVVMVALGVVFVVVVVVALGLGVAVVVGVVVALGALVAVGLALSVEALVAVGMVIRKMIIASRTLRVSTFVECIKAAHLSVYVQSAFANQCGMFLVGSPGVMKTSLLESLDGYESVLPLSDVNTKMLSTVVKRQLTNNTIRTLVFPEMQRIYERDPRTAAGVEGTIRALVEEGYRGASLEDPTVQRFRARACVIGAMTESFRDEQWDRWNKSGFTRRFLWCLVRLSDPSILLDAVEFNRYATMDGDIVAMPTPGTRLPDIDESMRKKLRPLVRKQPQPANVAYELICRMTAVLDFYYKRAGVKKRALDTMIEFSNCLIGGADLVGLSFPNGNGK